MGYTLAEKVLARASGLESATAGEIVKARVDVAFMPDITAVLAIRAMKDMGRSHVWDTEKVVFVLDHIAPPSSINAANVHKEIREFVEEQGVRNFYDVECGVCHQVLPEHGHVVPGELIVGADSHTCTHGAFGAFATGVGSTDMGAVLAFGKLWFKVPETINVVVDGALQPHVTAKDVILSIAGKIGVSGANYMALEFRGDAVRNMGVSGRMTLCNMAVEMGAKAGLIEPDEKTREYLSQRNVTNYKAVYSDADAKYKRVLNLNVSDLEPQVACPHNVDNVHPVSELGDVKVNQVFIGSCTNGRVEDLKEAHSILKGRKVHRGVRLLVVPASRLEYQKALSLGIVSDLVEAGAIVSNPSCAACFGGSIGILASGEVGLTTSNRNFRGRQGSPEAKVYLSSALVAAASALTGRITDPKEMMA